MITTRYFDNLNCAIRVWALLGFIVEISIAKLGKVVEMR